MKSSFFYWFCCFIFITTASLQAQTAVKTAYVRYDSIYRNTPEYVDFLKYQKELDNHSHVLINAYEVLLYEALGCGTCRSRTTENCNTLSDKLKSIQDETSCFFDTVSYSLETYKKNLQTIAYKREHQWIKSVAQQQQIDLVFDKDSVLYYFDETVIDITQEVINQDTTVYDWVATMPSFEGGHHALHKYLRENIQINNNYFQAEGCYTVYVIFIVEKDGTVSNLHLKLPQAITKTFTQTDFLITPMPKWIAGTHNGYTKRVEMVLPMKIKVSF